MYGAQTKPGASHGGGEVIKGEGSGVGSGVVEGEFKEDRGERLRGGFGNAYDAVLAEGFDVGFFFFFGNWSKLQF